MALAIVRGHTIVHRFNVGCADPTRHRITADTPFILKSPIKSITAVAVLQQVDVGRIALDVPVWRYLPWFRTYDRAASNRIAVRQLLNHTSGMLCLRTLVRSTTDVERGRRDETMFRWALRREASRRVVRRGVAGAQLAPCLPRRSAAYRTGGGATGATGVRRGSIAIASAGVAPARTSV
jgi:CubicO group peptidase (beta-lactamase class C family)